MHKFILILHILGATVWTGGHLVLSLGFLTQALRKKDPTIVENYESVYERIGIPALILQVFTGLWLGTLYVPRFSDWIGFGDHFSTLLTLKLILLLLTILLALHARFRVIPKLTEKNLRYLAGHILAVTIIGILFIWIGVGVRMGGLF